MAAKTISLGMIVRNEARTIAACLDSVLPYVDEVVIGFAGESTDGTREIVLNYAAKYPRFSTMDITWTEDFSEARNQVLAVLTGDYFLWLDGDDTLENGHRIREIVRQHPNIDAFFFGYDYARQDGINICYLVRERLLKNPQNWHWIGKVHEVCAPVDGFYPHNLKIDDILVVHHKPAGKHDPDRNIKLLYAQILETEPNPDPRLLVYLGAELSQRNQIREAIAAWTRFVRLSGWDEERYQAQHHIADAWRAMGEINQAIEADTVAISIMPDWPDAYFGLAETYYDSHNYKAAIEMTKVGVSKEKPETLLILNDLEYSYNPLIILSLSYLAVGDLEAGLENLKAAYAIKPTPQIKKQIDLVTDEIGVQRATQAFIEVRNFLGRHDEWIKARKLFDCVPKLIEHSPKIMDVWQRTMRQTAHIGNPEIMADFYNGNPGWIPAAEVVIDNPAIVDFPRLKFAIQVANRINAKTIADWGCSDGFLSIPLAKVTGAHVTGFDLDPRCVDLAQIRATSRGVDASFQVGDIAQIGGWEGEKADLALIFEVLEHVVDPADILRRIELTAKHVAITTPYLAWERGKWPEWDSDEIKGHIRIFDQFDMERLLTPRGRIWNLFRWDNSGHPGWLVADYEVGATTDQNIIIGALGSAEAWSPLTLRKQGLGGSETAVIRLAEELAKRGHRVIVYTNCDEPGYYNGVCYRDQSQYRPEIACDLYIAWRGPEAADLGIRAKHKVLWMHDMDTGERITPARADAFEKIVVLSNWHKDHMRQVYPFIQDDHFVILGNGVDFDRFDQQVPREPKRVFYSSSPDRGLDVILSSIWPQVVKEVPDAELHLYYGWNSFDKFASLPQFRHLHSFKQSIVEAISNTRNVTQHGRISQEALAREMCRGSIWLYPTYFDETYCITAVEAQLAGAIPITNHRAALAETVQTAIFIDGDVRDPSVQAQFAKATIEALLSPNTEEMREVVRSNVKAQSWSRIAKLWEENFLREE